MNKVQRDCERKCVSDKGKQMNEFALFGVVRQRCSLVYFSKGEEGGGMFRVQKREKG